MHGWLGKSARFLTHQLVGHNYASLASFAKNNSKEVLRLDDSQITLAGLWTNWNLSTSLATFCSTREKWLLLRTNKELGQLSCSLLAPKKKKKRKKKNPPGHIVCTKQYPCSSSRGTFTCNNTSFTWWTVFDKRCQAHRKAPKTLCFVRFLSV